MYNYSNFNSSFNIWFRVSLIYKRTGSGMLFKYLLDPNLKSNRESSHYDSKSWEKKRNIPKDLQKDEKEEEFASETKDF